MQVWRLKGLRHADCYLFKGLIVSLHHLILKIIVQFCYSRLYLVNETFPDICCYQWQGWMWIKTPTFSSYNTTHAKTIMVHAPS